MHIHKHIHIHTYINKCQKQINKRAKKKPMHIKDNIRGNKSETYVHIYTPTISLRENVYLYKIYL